MRKSARPYRPRIHIVHAFLLVAILAGCGGADNSSRPHSAAMTSAAGPIGAAGKTGRIAQDANSQNGKAATKNKTDSPLAIAEELPALSKLRALPLLASLSDREKGELLRHTRPLSPSGRLTIINSYPALATLTNPQKQQLLNQIETIIPVTIPAVLLVCECGSDIQRRLCVPESCSNQDEIQSLCNEACGTLPAFRSRCVAGQRC